MKENFTSGSVGRAPGDRCLYPEDRQFTRCRLCACSLRSHCRTQAPPHKLRLSEALDSDIKKQLHLVIGFV